jgi:hypothetical protein
VLTNLWIFDWLRGAALGGAADRERLVCHACGAWMEFPRGKLNQAAADWLEPGSPEDRERQRLADRFSAFFRRHRDHPDADEGAVRLYRPRQAAFWRVTAASEESFEA